MGLVLESVYDTDYKTLVNDFAQNELGLTNTRISTGDGDLGNDWEWKDGDAYLSAGLSHRIYLICFPMHKCSLKAIRIFPNAIRALTR